MFAIVAAVLVIAGGLAGVWAWRSSGTRSAREVALPEALRLADLDRYGEAFVLATTAERAMPRRPGAREPVAANLPDRSPSRPSPEGCGRVVQRHRRLTARGIRLGRTPLTNIRVPRGVFRWRMEKAGFDSLDIVRATELIPIMPAIGGESGAGEARARTPAGMVPVAVASRRSAADDHRFRLQHVRSRRRTTSSTSTK